MYGFLEQVHRDHFYFGKADGEKARYMWFREVEKKLNAQGGRKAATVYDAIGAPQMAKASFAGMRLLHRANEQIAVWPFDIAPRDGSVIVEIYGRLYLKRAGGSGGTSVRYWRGEPARSSRGETK